MQEEVINFESTNTCKCSLGIHNMSLNPCNSIWLPFLQYILWNNIRIKLDSLLSCTKAAYLYQEKDDKQNIVYKTKTRNTNACVVTM